MARLMMLSPYVFKGLAPQEWIVAGALTHTWTCARRECRREQRPGVTRTYAPARGSGVLYAMCGHCAETVRPGEEIDVD